jgi:hypothetical protein
MFIPSCRNPSLGFATKAKGLQGCGPRGSPGVKARESPGIKAKRLQGCGPRRSLRQKEAWESHHILPGVLESVRECEGVNPHTPKATPTLGGGVPEDSQNFRERLQESKLNGLWRFLYHWKFLET